VARKTRTTLAHTGFDPGSETDRGFFGELPWRLGGRASLLNSIVLLMNFVKPASRALRWGAMERNEELRISFQVLLVHKNLE
jgi:hypothetical protein